MFAAVWFFYDSASVMDTVIASVVFAVGAFLIGAFAVLATSISAVRAIEERSKHESQK